MCMTFWTTSERMAIPVFRAAAATPENRSQSCCVHFSLSANPTVSMAHRTYSSLVFTKRPALLLALTLVHSLYLKEARGYEKNTSDFSNSLRSHHMERRADGTDTKQRSQQVEFFARIRQRSYGGC